MHVKLNVKKLVCAKHVAQNNSRSVNFHALVRCSQRIIRKAAGLVSGGFFAIWRGLMA